MSLEELMTFKVTSTTKTDVSLRSAPGTVYSLSQKDFALFGIKTIDDLFWYIPGVQPYRYKKNDVMVVRGVIERFNSRTQIRVDDAVTRNGYYNHFEIDDFIPIEWVEDVEIVLGPGSALYGANAFSGIVNLELLGFSEQPELKATVKSQFDPTLPQVVGTFRNRWLVLGVTGADGDMSAPDYNIDGTGFDQLTESQLWHGFCKLKFADRGTLFIRHGLQEKPYLNNKQGSRVILRRNPLVIGAEYGLGETTKQGAFTLRLTHTKQLDEEWSEPLHASEKQHVDYSTADLTYNKATSRADLLFGLSYGRDDPVDVRLRSGEQMLEDPSVIEENYAFFAQSILRMGDKLTLTLGLRYDWFNEFDDKPSARAALVYAVDPSSVVKLMAGTAIRTPSLREWDKDMEDTSFAQPMVRPEEMMTYEVSYNTVRGNFYWDVTLYHNRFKKLLLERPTPPTPDDPEGGADEYFYNSDNLVSMVGAELNAKYRLGRTAVGASYSYVDTDDGSGNQIDYVRRNQASANLSYRFYKSHMVNVSVVGMSGTDDTNDERFTFDEPDGFLYFNASLTGDLGDDYSYTLGFRNTADTTVYDPYYRSSSYTGVERTEDRKIWALLTYRFR